MRHGATGQCESWKPKDPTFSIWLQHYKEHRWRESSLGYQDPNVKTEEGVSKKHFPNKRHFSIRDTGFCPILIFYYF